jgi:hypothetical protein
VDLQTKGGDFYMATTGDLNQATSGDFYMATDSPLQKSPLIRTASDGRSAPR